MKTKLNEAKKALEDCHCCLILTHKKPDGDTLGSAAALCHALRQLGKEAYLAKNPDVTPRLSPFVCDLWAPQGFMPKTIISVDVADTVLLPQSMLEYARSIDICIDHHPSNSGFGKINFIKPQAAATGEIIWELLGKGAFNSEALSALYVAIATDTGCFRFSNTTPQSHIIAAHCIEAGVDFHGINRDFFIKKSKTRFEIERHLFDNLLFKANDKVAGCFLTRAFLDSLGATDDDLDNLSTLTTQLEGIMCGIVLTENRQGGSYKASVRTSAPLDASKICMVFGGGGHARAAGCTLDADGEKAREMLMDAACKELSVIES